MKLRRPLLAGSWYPASFEECENLILSWKKGENIRGKKTGGIVPHAGWFFSGETASMVIEELSFSKPDLVILFGFHMSPFSKIRVMSTGGYETPLGSLFVFEDLVLALEKDFDFIRETPSDFEPDNTIEVQLPIIRYFMGDVPIFCCGLPPDKSGLEFAEKTVSQAKKMGKNPVVIGSTDLTHYGPDYDFMPVGTGGDSVKWVKEENDRSMVDLLLEMNPEKVIDEGINKMNACCSGAAAGAVLGASLLGAKKGELLKYTTSHEKTGGDNFVGYCGIIYK